MTEQQAADFLWAAINMSGMGTFDESEVVAIWHDGTRVTLGSYGDFRRAVQVLAAPLALKPIA